MAYTFSLWAECADEDSRVRLAAHFSGISHTLVTGRTIRWEATLTKPPDDPAIEVFSDGLPAYHIQSLEDAVESTEVGLRLYAHLRTAPDFLFARADWEAYGLSLSEFKDTVRSATDLTRLFLDLPSCVITESLYRELGSLDCFSRFCPGYKRYVRLSRPHIVRVTEKLFPSHSYQRRDL